MNENLIAPEIDQPNYKLHKIGSFRIAAFFGGPIAIGIMTFRNYLNLDRGSDAKKWLLYSILTSIVMTIAIIYMPAQIIDYMPFIAWSLLYSFIAGEIYKVLFTDIGQKHLDNKGDFFNGWYTFVIMIVSYFIEINVNVFVTIALDPTMDLSDLMSAIMSLI